MHYAPRVALGLGMSNPPLEDYHREVIRNGPYVTNGYSHHMPAFGREVLSDVEVESLIDWLIYAPPIGGADMTNGVPKPAVPAGHGIVLEILDEAPWFRDDATDVRDPSNDRRRVVLSAGDYVKVVNRGKTWHTVSNRAFGKDTGFIGWADNIPWEDVGYYYLEDADLQSGAWKYGCLLHPYMQVEIVTPGDNPMPLTHVSKLPIPPPATGGIGEVWVGLQTFANPGGPNGAVDVIAAPTWTRQHIPALGNNPHNGWIGRSRDGSVVMRNVAMYANWHDVTMTVIDADTKTVLGSPRAGAANAHVITAPGNPDPVTGGDRWLLTVMGSNKAQEMDPFQSLLAGGPVLPAVGQSGGILGAPAFSPHGLWFLDDGDHFLTANTLGGTASLWSLSRPWSDPAGQVGTGCQVANVRTGGASPLAASVFNTGEPGSSFYRAYTNNAGTDDISVYTVDATSGAESLSRVRILAPLGNATGNIALADTMATPVRWAHMPIQCAISPPDASVHGRFMVVCNQASFNASIVHLDVSGLPRGIYTVPAGLGCHGIAFGRKDTGDPSRIAYYAYVTNTFEDYVSVYDLEILNRLIRAEAIGTAPAAFAPGGATELVRVEGHAAMLLLGQPSGNVPITVFSPDARGLVHVGDVPLTAPAAPGPRCYLQEHVWVDAPGYGETMLDLDLKTSTGAMGVFCTPLPPPWN